MFDFFKKKIKGFVDKFKKSEDLEEQEELEEKKTEKEKKTEIIEENISSMSGLEQEESEEFKKFKEFDEVKKDTQDKNIQDKKDEEVKEDEKIEEKLEVKIEEKEEEKEGKKIEESEKEEESENSVIKEVVEPSVFESDVIEVEKELSKIEDKLLDEEKSIFKEEKELKVLKEDFKEDLKGKVEVDKEIEENLENSEKSLEENLEEKIDESKEENKGFFSKITRVFSHKKLSEEEFERLFEDLEISLLENNVAFEVVEKLKEELKQSLLSEKVSRFSLEKTIKSALKSFFEEIFLEHTPLLRQILEKKKENKPFIILFLGVNGSGKTTTVAKIAYFLKQNNLVPVFAASDTFRAAAIQQLEEHAKNLNVKIIKHDYGSDSAAVAFDAVKHAESGKADVVLIDTAGRLHNNENLIKEVEKIKRVVNPDLTFFVGESIAGNDLIEQAVQFNDKVSFDGIILTKYDVDDKQGASLSVSFITKKPIYFLTTGQGYEDIKEFDKEEVINSLLE